MQLEQSNTMQIKRTDPKSKQPGIEPIYQNITVTPDYRNTPHYEQLLSYFFQEEKRKHMFDVLLKETEHTILQTSLRCEGNTGYNLQYTGSKKTTKYHECKYCGKTFNKAQALGGHISKIHPGVEKEQGQTPKKTRKTKQIEKSQNGSVSGSYMRMFEPRRSNKYDIFFQDSRNYWNDF